MKITVNGKPMELKEGARLLDLLSGKGLESGKVVVEYNYEILKKEEFDKILLKENDTLEILKFVGGG